MTNLEYLFRRNSHLYISENTLHIYLEGKEVEKICLTPLSSKDNWLLQEHKGPILTDKEKQYLEGVLKPFKDKVRGVGKNNYRDEYSFLYINVNPAEPSFPNESIELPAFKKDEMYKGMKVGKPYTLDELGLFEEEE